MNMPINTAIALMSLDSPMTTLGSARRDRQVRRTVRSLSRGPGRHQHLRHRARSLPPPV